MTFIVGGLVESGSLGATMLKIYIEHLQSSLGHMKLHLSRILRYAYRLSFKKKIQLETSICRETWRTLAFT